MTLTIQEKEFTIPKTIECKKVKNMKYFFASKSLIWRQKWVASVRHGNLPVVRRVSSGRVIVVLF